MASRSLLQPQEIEVFYILPTLRKHLAIAMKKKGLKQNQISVLLDIEEAAVSQYVSNKRGNKIKFNQKIIREIELSAKKIKDKISLLREMQRLLQIIHHTHEICRIHKQISKIPENCSPSLIHCCKR